MGDKISTETAIETLRALTFEGPPTTIQQLEQRVTAIANALEVTGGRARVLVSSVIVSQMLPADTLVKGGIGVKLRLGEVGTRATRDVDVVARDRERFLAGLTERLQIGWGTVPPSRGDQKRDRNAPPRIAFTGTARAGRQATPDGVAPEYLMEPYNVTLNFLGSTWAAVPLEVAHDEIDGTEYADRSPGIAGQIAAIGAVLCFGELGPVPLISLELQLAQKIHASTHPGSQRAHDLVDLQLLWHASIEGGHGLDLMTLRQLCERTFEYRRTHTWPPDAALPDILDPTYQTAREEAGPNVDLALTLTDAVAWLNDRIAEISASSAAAR